MNWLHRVAISRRSLIRLSLGLSAVLTMTSVVSCSPSKSQDEMPEPQEPTYIKVQNQAFLDMNIYAIRSSQRIRLGQATGNSTTRLTIPATMIFGVTTLSFQAVPIGGNRQSLTQEISVTPGDEVLMIIPP